MRRGSVTRAPQHTYILPRGRTQVVSILCSFKLNISQSFGVGSYMDIRTRTHVYGRTRAHAHARAGAHVHARTHARIPQGGACHKFLTDKIRQNPTRENLKALFRVESCRKS